MSAARTALCLQCRTALAAGEQCDAHPRAVPVDLADARQRGRALDAVWGPPHVRAKQTASAGAAGGTAGGIAEGCGASCEGCGELGNLGKGSGEALVAVLVIIAAAVVAILLYYLIKHLIHAIRRYRARPKPRGSRWHPSPSTRVLRGTITDATPTTAPLSETPCAAWSVVIGVDRASEGPIMLRDGATAGLMLTLDDGRTVSIPAGRIRVHADGTKYDVRDEYLRRIDPEYTRTDATPVIPAERAREARLVVGDKVEIISGLAERFDPNAPAGYREAPQTQLVIEGVPTLVRA